MYRLLIVDNEEIIVDHLYEIFRGMDHLNLDVYKAYGSKEAIEWLNRTRIDIVLTDIDMPDMDGLQLMKEVFRIWPQCKVILLTGHSEFGFVYKAIQHRDVSYILKSEDIEKVIQVVEENLSKIRKEIKTEDLISNAKKQVHMALDLFQEDYLMCILKGDRSVQITEEQFRKLSIPLNVQWPITLVLGMIDKFPENCDYMQQMQLLYSVRQIIQRYIATHLNVSIILDENRRFVIFVQPKESLFSTISVDAEMRDQFYNKTLSFLKGILEVIQSASQENFNMPISLTVSSKASRWDEIANQYHSLQHLLNYRIGIENKILLIDSEFNDNIDDESVTENTYDVECLEGGKLEKTLKLKNLAVIEQYLESGQREDFYEALEQFLTPLRGIHSKNNIIAQEAFYTVSLYLMSYINRWGLIEKVVFQMGQIKLMRTELFDSWGDAALYLMELASVLFNMQTIEQKKRADNIIDFLQGFIKENLDEDLSLVRLAEQVHLNPSYLSRIYKQETGRNLTEFIDSTRLTKAKNLLKSENSRINDIARRVGYESATSFNRFFKKATGYSPQEYREKHLFGML